MNQSATVPTNSDALGPFKVAFIGTDQIYFKKIQDLYKILYPRQKFKFDIFTDKKDIDIQKLIPKLITPVYHVYYIEYEHNPHATYYLVRILKRQQILRDSVVVGLIDSRKDPSRIHLAMNSGAHFNVAKESDVQEAVLGPISITKGLDLRYTKAERAQISIEYSAFIPVKLNYITPTQISFETNHEMKAGTQIEMDFIFKDKLIPIPLVSVQQISQTNIYYDYKYSIIASIDYVTKDLSQMFFDEVTKEEENKRKEILVKKSVELDRDNPETAKILESLEKDIIAYQNDLKKPERKEQIMGDIKIRIDNSKKILKKYVEENSTDAPRKDVKLLMVDRQGELFKQFDKLSQDYPVSIRYQSYILEADKILTTYTPHLISLQLEHLDEQPKPESTETKIEIHPTINDLKKVKEIVSHIKNLPPQNWPFIILFNSKELSLDGVKKEIGYNKVLIHKPIFDLDVILKMAEMIGNGLEKNRVKESEKKAFFKKSDPSSAAFIKTLIKIEKATETEVFFTTKIPLHESEKLFIKTPIQTYISIIPMNEFLAKEFPPSNGLAVLRGLFNCLSEEGKISVRGFVNNAFFNQIDDKRNQEYKKEEDEKERMKKEEEEKNNAAVQSAVVKDKSKKAS